MLISERLELRKVTSDDIPKYYTWRNDFDVMRYTNPVFDLTTYENTQTFIKQIMQSTNSKSYMIEVKEDNRVIGITSLIHIDYKNRNSECIIDIGEKDFWGKGLGTEALSLLLDYAFLELNLHKVNLRVFSFNSRAIRLYEKLGFNKEGEIREQLYRNGKWHNIILMGVLQKDYLDSKISLG